MGLADRIAQIRAYENSVRTRKQKEDERLTALQTRNQIRADEEQTAIEANREIVLPLLRTTDARAIIEEAQRLWGIGQVSEHHHITPIRHQCSASVSLSHSFLELEELYRGYRDEGNDIGPRTGTRIFQSGVSLSISVHTSGSGRGRPHAFVSYNKYKKTNGVDFPQNRGIYRRTTEEPWGSPASPNDRIGRPLVYGLEWVDIIIEDPKRTRDGVEYQLAKILSQVGSPSESERFKREAIAKDPFVPRHIKRQLSSEPHITLPWYRKILG